MSSSETAIDCGPWTKKHLLGIEELSVAELETIFKAQNSLSKQAVTLKRNIPSSKVRLLQIYSSNLPPEPVSALAWLLVD
jgi:hypothetical protein